MWARGEIRFTEWFYLLVLRGAFLSPLLFQNSLFCAEMPVEAGVAAFGERRYLAALERFREPWEAAETAGAPDQVRGKILTNTGACLLGLGDYRGALAQFVRARAYAVRGGNRDHLAALDANIASVYLLQDDRENAVRIYRRALGWLE